ncbi:carbohydrate kinase family protein [Sphaerotilus sp.]|uniref:carbohydrate kinase family protein n=1 Tax=Sphaerotilus sp. TaxID=2093942 RepID=UPI002ACD3A2B|nr:carbohydrate kinase family protein [Sphaerotilus sp.]MDZ7854727.1 carbohydrate kinase family protein [Sphaerotilus sp.]
MTPTPRPVVCLGGANVDRKLRVAAPVRPGSSNPVSARETFGGVARNVAENLARCGVPVQLLTAVGQDAAGRTLLDDAVRCGIDTSAVEALAGVLTGSYTAVLNPDGSLHLALAHMDLCEQLTPEWLHARSGQCRAAGLVVADLNLPAATLAALVTAATDVQAPPLVLVAVSEAKMERLPARLHGVALLVLNQGELAAWAGTDRLADGVARLQAAGVRDVVVTLGAAGLCHTTAAGGLAFLAAPAVPPEAVVDVTGAGDALAAGLCHGLWTGAVAAHGWSPSCAQALARAALTVQSAETVVPDAGFGRISSPFP